MEQQCLFFSYIKTRGTLYDFFVAATIRYFSFNFSAIGQEDWEKSCKNVESVQKSYWAKDIAVDEEMKKW